MGPEKLLGGGHSGEAALAAQSHSDCCGAKSPLFSALSTSCCGQAGDGSPNLASPHATVPLPSPHGTHPGHAVGRGGATAPARGGRSRRAMAAVALPPPGRSRRPRRSPPCFPARGRSACPAPPRPGSAASPPAAARPGCSTKPARTRWPRACAACCSPAAARRASSAGATRRSRSGPWPAAFRPQPARFPRARWRLRPGSLCRGLRAGGAGARRALLRQGDPAPARLRRPGRAALRPWPRL